METKNPSFIPLNLFGSISTINTSFFVFTVSCCCFSFFWGGGVVVHFHQTLKQSNRIQQYAPHCSLTVDRLENFKAPPILLNFKRLILIVKVT